MPTDANPRSEYSCPICITACTRKRQREESEIQESTNKRAYTSIAVRSNNEAIISSASQSSTDIPIVVAPAVVPVVAPVIVPEVAPPQDTNTRLKALAETYNGDIKNKIEEIIAESDEDIEDLEGKLINFGKFKREKLNFLKETAWYAKWILSEWVQFGNTFPKGLVRYILLLIVEGNTKIRIPSD